MSQKPCTIIRDAISISPSGIETIDSPLIDVYNFKDIKCANPQSVFSEKSLPGAVIIARTIRGSVCGFSKPLGKGTFIHLGTWIGFDTEGQKPVYEALLSKSTAKLRQANSNNYHINVRERFTNEHSAMLFVGNYYNEEHKGTVTYTHPKSGETISIPYSQNETEWPAVYGILSPICLKVSEDLYILHTTSDILSIQNTDSELNITLFGNRDLAGEIVFEGVGNDKINSASIDGEAVKVEQDDKRIVLVYSHKHKSEMNLKIKYN